MIGAIAIRPARWSEVTARIATVPQYTEPANVTIQQERIRPEQLCPLCRLVRVYRLTAIQDLVMAFNNRSIALFDGVWLTRPDGTEHLLPPPIIEVHDHRYVIVDGTHRIFFCLQSHQEHVGVAVVRGLLPPLPADILTWADVEVINRKVPRHQKFRNFDPTQFRRIREFIDDLGDRR